MSKLLDDAINKIMKTWKDKTTARKIAMKSLQKSWKMKARIEKYKANKK